MIHVGRIVEVYQITIHNVRCLDPSNFDTEHPNEDVRASHVA